MLVESEEKLTGNARFEGFSIELASELSNILGFNFTFKLVDDGKVRSGVYIVIEMTPSQIPNYYHLLSS